MPKSSANKKLFLNFVWHVEEIADKNKFVRFFDFCQWFYQLTGVKSVATIITPLCPKAKKLMADFGVTADEYLTRVEKLAQVCLIGYHGHFYNDEQKLILISHDNYQPERVKEQFNQEVAWLKSNGFKPEIYSGGSWFLSSEIIELLVQNGFRIDCTIRQKHLNQQGGKFIPDDQVLARGEVSDLPGSSIKEIQSIFYPVSFWWRIKRWLNKIIHEGQSPSLYCVFPGHEGEVLQYGDRLMKNIKKISRQHQLFEWFNIEEVL